MLVFKCLILSGWLEPIQSFHCKVSLQLLEKHTNFLVLHLRPFLSWSLPTFLMCPLLLSCTYPSLQFDYNCLNIPYSVTPLCFCTSCALYRLSSSFLYLPSEYLLKFQEYSSTPSFLKIPLRNTLFLPLLCSFTINISTQYFLPVSMSCSKWRNPVSLIFIIPST